MNQPSSNPQTPKKLINEPPKGSTSVPESGEHPSREIVEQTRSALQQSGERADLPNETPRGGSLVPHQRKTSERVTVYRAKSEENENPASGEYPSENPDRGRDPVRPSVPDDEEPVVLEENAPAVSDQNPDEIPRDARLEEINNIILESSLDEGTKAQLGAKVTELSQEKMQLVVDLNREQDERKKVEKKRKRDLTVFSAVTLLLLLTNGISASYFGKNGNNVSLANADGGTPVPLNLNNANPGEGKDTSEIQGPSSDSTDQPEQQLEVGGAQESQPTQDQPSQTQQNHQRSSYDQSPESLTIIPALPETALERSISRSTPSENVRAGSPISPEMSQLLEKASQGGVLTEAEIETIRAFRETQISLLRAQLRAMEDGKRARLDSMINEQRAQMNRTFTQERAQLEQRLRELEANTENRFSTLRAQLERVIGERRRELDQRINTLRNSTDNLFHQSRNAQQSGSF